LEEHSTFSSMASLSSYLNRTTNGHQHFVNFDFSHLQLDEKWNHYVTSQFSDFMIIVFGTFIVHELCWFFLNLPYIILDEFRLGDRWKINPSARVPDSIRWKSFMDLIKGHVFQLLPTLVVAYPLLSFVGFSSTIPLPTL
jgi:hypothetical protein